MAQSKMNTEEPMARGPSAPGVDSHGHTPNRSSEDELQKWSPRRIAIVATLWVAGAAVLAVMSVYLHAHPRAELPGDLGIAEWIQQLHQPLLRSFVNFASDANWPTPAGIIAIAAILVFALFRRFRAAIATAVSGFGADLANVTLNGIVQRQRPHNVHIHAVQNLGLHSFPSGHVTHATAFYGMLLYLSVAAVRTHARWRPWLRAVQVVCVYFIVFVGPSRVLEGEHWPSDAFASYVLGALVLVLAIALYHLMELWKRRRRERQQPIPATG